jgi:hypothetical protein
MPECNAGLGNFHSLAIDLGFAMLSEMPAIIARRTPVPPRDVALAPPDRRRFSSLRSSTLRRNPNKSFNNVSCVIQQLVTHE